jgi:hypothetical protein
MQIRADGLAVPAQMPRDRRHRPSPRLQRMYFHSFSPSEHRPGGLLRVDGLVAVNLGTALLALVATTPPRLTGRESQRSSPGNLR